MNRLRSLYAWDPAFRMTRQGKVASFTCKAPQTSGMPGWLCLTRDEVSKPIAFWVPRKEGATPQIFRIVCDERCFEDTILRVEYTSTHVYLADVWMWNGVNMFKTKTFAERAEFLRRAFEAVYTPCPLFETRKVVLRDDATADVRGYEYYTDAQAEKGVFVESKPEVSDKYEIVSTDIPDVYKVADVGYLRVRTMALSKHLRKLGPVFTLECTQNEDGTWTPRIESLSNTNGS